MDLASVVAALASVGVRVSGSNPNNNIQGDSSRACPTGLAGPEPSGTHNDPGQHFHAFTLGVAVAVVLVPDQPTKQACRMGVGPRPHPARFLPIHHGSGGVVGLEVLGMHSFNSTNWWWLLRRVLQHWTGRAAGAGQPVVVEVVDAALLVGRWVWSVHFLHGRGAVRVMLWTALLAP